MYYAAKRLLSPQSLFKKVKITFSGFPEKVNLSPSFNRRYSFDVVIFVKVGGLYTNGKLKKEAQVATELHSWGK